MALLADPVWSLYAFWDRGPCHAHSSSPAEEFLTGPYGLRESCRPEELNSGQILAHCGVSALCLSQQTLYFLRGYLVRFLVTK